MQKFLYSIIGSVFLFMSTFLAAPNQARCEKELTIDINQGIFEAIPLGIIGFDGHETADEISKIVANDLRNSGVFEILNQKGSQLPRHAIAMPSFWEWRSKNGTLIVVGQIYEGDRIEAAIRVFDVDSENLILEKKLKAPSWRLLAHRIANAIYEKITGEIGYFDTQIVYTAQTGPATKKIRQIAIMDQDGANCSFLTQKNIMALTPRFSHKGNKVVFVGFKNLKMNNYILNLKTRDIYPIPIPGVSISPRFSADGGKIVFCLANNGVTSIYLYDLYAKNLTRLTQTKGRIDVSPSYSPDGSKMVFASDRSGHPKLYIMDIQGNVHQLTTGAGSYLSPVWSPDGNWIGFIKKHQGEYYLGIITPEGTKERLLASSHVIDHPSWAPNSRLLVFASQDRYFGPFHLYMVDLSGRALRKIPTSFNGVVHEGNHPDWCPNLEH